MKTKLFAALGVMVMAVAVTVATLAVSGSAGAQNADVYEYGQLVSVPRAESYELDFGRWAGDEDDKKYLQSHVFIYEEGVTTFGRQVNYLRRVNELAAQGWELHDAQAGILRRKK